MRVKILGRWWQFKREPIADARGLCDPPNMPGKAITVDSRLTGEEELAVTLHECGHAALWALDEDFIDEWSEDVARMLWRLGYRRSG